ncbi:MAG: Holliday junction branch migration protein RuvA [Micrococcaceae bacterium]
MISTITGKALHLDLDSAVIEVSGIGFKVFMTPDTLSTVKLHQQASLQTYLAVKEDSLTLFGFKTPYEREVFETLLAVNGIGAKTALSILSVYSPEDIALHANAGDDKAFSKVPGIGPKGARRIVLELADKLVPAEDSSQKKNKNKTSDHYDQAVLGLVGLGWSEKESKKSLDALIDSDAKYKDATVAQLLKDTLAAIGKASR